MSGASASTTRGLGNACVSAMVWASALGCTCAGAPERAPSSSSSVTSATSPPSGVEAPRAVGATASASDASLDVPAVSLTGLPARGPALTVRVEALALEVDNTAVIDTWSPDDQARVRAGAGAGAAPDFPRVTERVPAADPLPILMPGVRDALSRALSAERARSGAGAPLAFDVVAAPSVAWGRVSRALFAASLAGLTMPRLVVAAPDGARLLALRAPSAAAAGDAERVVLGLSERGLTVLRGARRLAEGCAAGVSPADPAARTAPTLPLAALREPGRLEACRDALRGAPRVDLAARDDVTYGTVARVLEVFAPAFAVEVIASAAPSERDP